MQQCFIVPRINFQPPAYAFSQFFLAKTLGSRLENIPCQFEIQYQKEQFDWSTFAPKARGMFSFYFTYVNC